MYKEKGGRDIMVWKNKRINIISKAWFLIFKDFNDWLSTIRLA